MPYHVLVKADMISKWYHKWRLIVCYQDNGPIQFLNTQVICMYYGKAINQLYRFEPDIFEMRFFFLHISSCHMYIYDTGYSAWIKMSSIYQGARCKVGKWGIYKEITVLTKSKWPNLIGFFIPESVSETQPSKLISDNTLKSRA